MSKQGRKSFVAIFAQGSPETSILMSSGAPDGESLTHPGNLWFGRYSASTISAGVISSQTMRSGICGREATITGVAPTGRSLMVVTPSARETDESGRRATLPEARSTHAGLRSTGPRSATVAFSNGGAPSARRPSDRMTYTGVDCRSKRSTESESEPAATFSPEMRRMSSRKYAPAPPSGRRSSVPTSSSPQTVSARPGDNSAAASEARQTENARAVICRFPS